ncbi:MAG TPA: hypothetical protein VF469_05840 [Kofleriaceae bacterium]
MSFGIIEAITLLLGLTGAGLAPNPKPPAPDQALRYAIADPDIVAHVDAASMIPGNYKLLGQLADQPQIRASPELQKLVREAVGEIEGARGIARFATGIDVIADIADATAFVQIAPPAEPSFVIAVHGKFAPANLEKMGAATGSSPTRVDAGHIVELGAGQPAVGLTRDGVMLVGTPGLVRDRLADGWHPPGHAAGTSLGYAADALADKPVFAVVVTMSPAARGELLKNLPSGGLAADLVTRHKVAALSVFHNGVGWIWGDSTRAGLDAMEQMSSGAIDLLRAAQIAPRGMAKIAVGALDAYQGKDPQVDDLIKHKADLLPLVEAYTGDGNFKVAVDKNPKALRLSVRATGKSASEVVPIGFVVPLGVLGYMFERGETETKAKAKANLAAPDHAAPSARPLAAPPAGKPPVAKPPARKP